MDGPPCTPYGPLARMGLTRQRRIVEHQPALSHVVAQRVVDYREHRQMFLVETTTHGGHYITGEAAVTFVDYADVGGASRDGHAFITPADRPFVRDKALRVLGASLREGTCVGWRSRIPHISSTIGCLLYIQIDGKDGGGAPLRL